MSEEKKLKGIKEVIEGWEEGGINEIDAVNEIERILEW